MRIFKRKKNKKIDQKCSVKEFKVGNYYHVEVFKKELDARGGDYSDSAVCSTWNDMLFKEIDAAIADEDYLKAEKLNKIRLSWGQE